MLLIIRSMFLVGGSVLLSVNYVLLSLDSVLLVLDSVFLGIQTSIYTCVCVNIFSVLSAGAYKLPDIFV